MRKWKQISEVLIYCRFCILVWYYGLLSVKALITLDAYKRVECLAGFTLLKWLSPSLDHLLLTNPQLIHIFHLK